MTEYLVHSVTWPDKRTLEVATTSQLIDDPAKVVAPDGGIVVGIADLRAKHYARLKDLWPHRNSLFGHLILGISDATFAEPSLPDMIREQGVPSGTVILEPVPAPDAPVRPGNI